MAAIAAIGVGVLAAMALASSPATLSVAKGVPVKGHNENVVVNSHGLTVYTLSGETANHRECTKANNCFSFWFPVKVGSNAKLTASRGVKGKLGSLRRNGFRQVTLKRHPLYTFIGDGGKKRRTVGEGVVSFGGTWHVVAAQSSSPQTMTGPTTTTSTTTTSTGTTTTPGYP